MTTRPLWAARVRDGQKGHPHRGVTPDGLLPECLMTV